MADEKMIQYLLERHGYMVSLRQPFNADWIEIRNYVRPITIAFNQITGQFQVVRTEMMYDGTAPDALGKLGSALHSYMTSPTERWFEVQVEGRSDLMKDPDVLDWLDQVADIIYAEYQRETSQFNLAIHECYLDVGSFGMSNLYQEWDNDTGGIIFIAKPLQYSYFMEDSKGRIDTVHFERDWSLRQIQQEFGQVLPPKLMEASTKENNDKLYRVIHCVYPRTDRIKGSQLPQNKPFASIWLCQTTKEILKESGYDSFPYQVGRWTKLAGETYGRGPAKICLPDIKMLNAMERTILKAGQKAVDPPLVLRNEGFMLPIRTSPGALIFKEDEESKIEPLKFDGNLPWAEEKATQKREFIRNCFYADLIQRAQKKAEQTAFEVQDERSEMLMLLGPILGRLQSELHGPMIARSYDLLNSHGKIPPSPAILQKQRLSIGYIGQAATAQRAVKATNITRFIQDLVPLAQINPGITDVIDFDAVSEEFARARSVPRSVIRSPKDLSQIRDQRNKMQAAQQIAQTAEPASNAIKNLADAQQKGGLPGV